MRRKRTEAYRAKDSFWISYSDMMAGMLFVFALILFMAVYQIVDLQKKKTIELQTKEAQLSTQQSLLLDQQAELADKEALLASSTLLLQEQQEELDTSKAALLLAQQRIDEQTALLASQQARIDKLIGLRSEIIEALRDKLNEAGLGAAVDKNTGAIAFSGAVLFDTGRNELKDSGKELLNRFIPIYLRTLMSSEYDDYIGEIIIEGHTDTSGSYLSNMRLSQERALAVVQYCFTAEEMRLSTQERTLLQSVLTVNGRSYADPVYTANGAVDMDASRRVVFKFRMKDAEMIDQMSAILEGAGE